MPRAEWQGLIESRLLIIYRLEPDWLAATLPTPLTPHVMRGSAWAAVWVTRLSHVRPVYSPMWMGVGARFAVVAYSVDAPDHVGPSSAIYIARRDCSSRLRCWLGASLGCEPAQPARIQFEDSVAEVRTQIESCDGRFQLSFHGGPAVRESGSTPAANADEAVGLFCGRRELTSGRRLGWEQAPLDRNALGLAAPLDVYELNCSWFDDASTAFAAVARPDSAWLQRNLSLAWTFSWQRGASTATPHALPARLAPSPG